jgi:anti-sigma factor RsiW
MTCLHEGILRARLDGELSGSELEAANQHLAVCTDCHSRFEKLSRRNGTHPEPVGKPGIGRRRA